jgi:uncharacterized membrane protein
MYSDNRTINVLDDLKCKLDYERKLLFKYRSDASTAEKNIQRLDGLKCKLDYERKLLFKYRSDASTAEKNIQTLEEAIKAIEKTKKGA